MSRGIIADHIYHVLNRGVDKRNIFLDKRDYFRFIRDLYEFNDENPVSNLNYFFRKSYMDIGRRYNPKLLVKILAFVLMPNHYHLLVIPVRDEGLSLFMKKLNMGYAKYFNERNKRSGALFQGKYKAVHVQREGHFIHLPYYIHLNPLDIKFPEWRERKIRSPKKALSFLKEYRWSSHRDYLGIPNFPSLIKRDFLLEYFGGEKEYEKRITEWLEELDLEDPDLKLLFLE